MQIKGPDLFKKILVKHEILAIKANTYLVHIILDMDLFRQAGDTYREM